MTPAGESRVRIGQVVKTQGIRGQVRVLTDKESTALSPGREVFLKGEKGEEKRLTVASARGKGATTILSFLEINEVAQAEQLVGASVYVEEKNLPVLPADEFYAFQLLGLEVQTEKGSFLGRVEEILPTGSNDVFVVRKDGEEVLIPAIEEVVIRVDLQNRVIVIRPLAGLLSRDDL